MPEPILAVDGLRKRFGTLDAVDGLSFKVAPNTVFGLLGPNGAGKTTTIRIISGELVPDAGQILLHGRRLSGSVADRVRIGLCPQELVLWDKLSCSAQLRFVGAMYGRSSRAARATADRLLEELDMTEYASTRASALSGGYRRRLNLAMALVNEPELVILDEPEAGLDPVSRVRVRQFVMGLATRASVLLTTHDMAEAERICDDLAIVDRGRIAAAGTPAQLRRLYADGELIELRFAGEIAVAQAAAAALDQRREEPDERGPDERGPDERGPDDRGPDAAGGDYTVRRSAGLVTVATTSASAVLPGLLHRLETEGIAPTEVRMRSTGLEDVFMAVTGRARAGHGATGDDTTGHDTTGHDTTAREAVR